MVEGAAGGTCPRFLRWEGGPVWWQCASPGLLVLLLPAVGRWGGCHCSWDPTSTPGRVEGREREEGGTPKAGARRDA